MAIVHLRKRLEKLSSFKNAGITPPDIFVGFCNPHEHKPITKLWCNSYEYHIQHNETEEAFKVRAMAECKALQSDKYPIMLFYQTSTRDLI